MKQNSTKTEHKKTWRNLNGVSLDFYKKPSGWKKGVWDFSSSVSRKIDSGDYKSLYFDVVILDEPLKAAVLEQTDNVCRVTVNEGFISCKYYVDRNGYEHIMPTIVVKDGDLEA